MTGPAFRVALVFPLLLVGCETQSRKDPPRVPTEEASKVEKKESAPEARSRQPNRRWAIRLGEPSNSWAGEILSLPDGRWVLEEGNNKKSFVSLLAPHGKREWTTEISALGLGNAADLQLTSTGLLRVHGLQPVEFGYRDDEMSYEMPADSFSATLALDGRIVSRHHYGTQHGKFLTLDTDDHEVFARKVRPEDGSLWQLTKLSLKGKVLWSQRLSWGKKAIEWIKGAPGRDGQIAIVGYGHDTSHMGLDCCVQVEPRVKPPPKIDSQIGVALMGRQGNLLWRKLLGTPRRDAGKDVVVDADGNVVIVGLTEGSFAKKNAGDFDRERMGSSDALIVKLSHQGEIVWQQQFGTRGPDGLTKVIADKNGDLVVGGYSYSNLSDPKDEEPFHSFVMRVTGKGKTRCTIPLGGNESAGISAIAIGRSENIVVVGSEGYLDANGVAFAQRDPDVIDQVNGLPAGGSYLLNLPDCLVRETSD